MTETPIMQEIRLALSRGPIRLFRNNCGVLQNEYGGWVHFGLADGSGDLVGWKTETITPDMVGQRIARFISVEVKRPKGRTDKDRAQKQKDWRDAVNNAGGVAIEARSVADAEAALK